MRETFPGVIRLWFGSLASIPEGFALCDGTQGTPDLGKRFPIGAGGAFAVDDIGGSSTHDHAFIGDGHIHVHVVPPGDLLAGPPFAFTTDTESALGTTDSANHEPPFHVLAYIMEL